MIFELSIKDFILIRDVKIGFDQGLNILTGETGAGKSMVLGAINMVLGGQANKDSIRLGAEKAAIRASFLSSESINALLTEQDIATDDDVLVISREINSKGKSFSRINSQIVTLSQLKSVTDRLLSIHGQNEHQNLLERDHQMNLLDAFGGEALLRIKDEVQAFFSVMQVLESDIAKLNKKSSERTKQLDFLNFQIQEIEQAKLKVDEDIALEKEFEYLSNLEHIQESVTHATNWLSGDFGEGALGMLSQLGGQFKKLEGFNMDLDELSSRMKELYYLMDDLSKDLDRFNEKLEMDPEKFALLERRLDEINNLKSKYGKQISDILDYLSKIKEEQSEYEAIESLIIEKNEALSKARLTYLSKAAELTKLRKEAAIHFEKALETELQALNMKATTFKIEIEASENALQTGMDEVDFVISTNIGQPFRPLKKVVSGGELSRIMLGIKIVLGKLDEVPTLVFDEVDAGISGITANIVGEKLAKLAQSCQILCITHLPQIAVYADHHFSIEKTSDGISTETFLKKIEGSEIEGEISRLVGGVTVTESTMKHAKEMLLSAEVKKKSF
jgi:DNA repair protein RecN (Recombination protein N)